MANARTSAAEGSYGVALKALQECLRYPDPDPANPDIRFEPAKPGAPTPRRDAYEALKRPCQGLGTRGELNEKIALLKREAAEAGDAFGMLDVLRRELMSKEISQEARQRSLEQLLALNDAAATEAALPGLFGEGATLDGESMTKFERVAYLVAWQQVMCANYGECVGPDSRDSHRECLSSGSCDYVDFETRVDRWVPGLLGRRVYPYYLRIQAHLDRRRFGAFGVP